MAPTLFPLGSWDVPTHEFFIGLGLLAALVVFWTRARESNEPREEMGWIVIGGLVAGGLFARVSAVWDFGASGASVGEIWLYGGRSVLGGLAGAYVGVEITKRLVGHRRSTGHLFAPAVALGMAIGRIGCFLTEQIGTTTSMPWGITVSPEVAAGIPNCPQCLLGAPMHPSFLYEITFHAVAFVVLWRGRDRIPAAASFKLYLLAYGGFRFLVEFVRGNPELALGLSGSQLFLLLTLPLLVVALVRPQAHRPPAPMEVAR
jgi:phosphatidylglycerol:prolipoprotein diacylglycerol transferase